MAHDQRGASARDQWFESAPVHPVCAFSALLAIGRVTVALSTMRFQATIELGGKTATGIPVPDDVVAALGSGKRPRVRVTVGGHTYQTTVAPMGGRFFVPLSAENRDAARVAAGETVEVDMQLDSAEREVGSPRSTRGAARTEPTRRHRRTHRAGPWMTLVEPGRGSVLVLDDEIRTANRAGQFRLLPRELETR